MIGRAAEMVGDKSFGVSRPAAALTGSTMFLRPPHLFMHPPHCHEHDIPGMPGEALFPFGKYPLELEGEAFRIWRSKVKTSRTSQDGFLAVTQDADCDRMSHKCLMRRNNYKNIQRSASL